MSLKTEDSKKHLSESTEWKQHFYRDAAIKTLHAGSRVRGASLIAQLVKNLPAMQETLVGFLGQEDPLEKG